ncbi:hypothetical protein WL05_01755 [Burkholderia ubonensis]|uniref:Putative tail fiber protein gp53-like C-terminal domain-containing protein n=1 Tax=Burkholderia ubonensis TaxID=101571 RepID=A0ABD4DU31_9BURK|nr:hypothetical protein [Burkholderia ubonensis]KVN76048.1 hypothetical protein WJ68_27150 [Burkholderia ubonensis]KVX59539.1 hypothetical protein WL05_01755 [Burkholderia ubonensis]KVZ56110.1 hypothetical protein WL19_07415 [Burkholderia ubonensis]KVZ81100.1 hypothetical protein WL24_17770 [Burkholderia ubonensis]
MSKLVESSQWEEDLYQIETSDPVEGGPDGVSNKQAKQLGGRTRYLKQQVEQSQSGITQHVTASDPHPQYATKADLAQEVGNLVGQAPESLNTLKEFADALGKDPNFATTMTNALALKAPIDSPTFAGTPKAPMPPQFDSSDKVASTAFVQRALGNMQIGTRIQSAANAIFSASHAGGSYTLEVASTTYVLPSLASVKPGATFEYLATVNAATVATAGADKMMTGSLVSSSTCVLNNGDTAKFVSDGTYWVLVSGSAALRLSLGDFGSSLASAGYQKLPSGLIVQWGAIGNVTTSATSASFPIAFTSAVYSVSLTATSNSAVAASLVSASNTGVSAVVSSGNVAVGFVAIGK